MLNIKKFNKGISLLELMLSIVIITALVLGATRYYTIARDNLRITQAMSMINEVASASYEWVRGETNFSNLTKIGVLVTAGLLPQKYSSPDNINPWHGSIAVAPSTNDLNLTMNKIPAILCDNTTSTLLTKIRNAADVDPAKVKCANGELSIIFKNP